MAVARRLGFSCGLDRFLAICSLVLSYRHAGFIACELSGRPDCLFRPRGRIALAHLDAMAAVARCRFQ